MWSKIIGVVMQRYFYIQIWLYIGYNLTAKTPCDIVWNQSDYVRTVTLRKNNQIM